MAISRQPAGGRAVVRKSMTAASSPLRGPTSKRSSGRLKRCSSCLLYTSDAADERSSVDLGGRRIIKKKKKRNIAECGVRNIRKYTDNGVQLTDNRDEQVSTKITV